MQAFDVGLIRNVQLGSLNRLYSIAATVFDTPSELMKCVTLVPLYQNSPSCENGVNNLFQRAIGRYDHARFAWFCSMLVLVVAALALAVELLSFCNVLVVGVTLRRPVRVPSIMH